MLDNEKVCDLFYREYRAQHEATDAIYTKYQFAVATIALIGGIVGALSRRDLLPLFWLRIDVCVYYILVFVSMAFIGCASVCLVISITPRKFQQLDGLQKWQKWRSDYKDDVIASGYGSQEPHLVDDAVAHATCEQATARLAEATDWNATKNNIKLRWFNMCFYFTVGAIGVVAAQAVMHTILLLNEVKLP
ncbi:MAG: hypothetical protein KF691_10455 [Phycisphaeraceae bacterium]|nr:hypothetical protein [Phycisphaeraceae bacterium]